MSFEAQKLLLLTVLLSMLRLTGLSPVSVVTSWVLLGDAQTAHLAIVVCIEDMLRKHVFLDDMALRALFENTVLVTVGIKHAVEVATGMTVVFVEGTETVVLVQHVVDLQLG